MSFWWDRVARSERPALPGPTSADVCVVGAGYTGLWTAYHLARAAPDLRVVVVEQRHVGYGASGRNGGWLTNSSPVAATGTCAPTARPPHTRCRWR